MERRMPKRPNVTWDEVGLTASDLLQIDRVAADLVADEPALLSSRDFGPFVAQGEGGGQQIIIGDQLEIPLLALADRPYLDHRMALLARPGDVVVLRSPVQAFFDYISQSLVAGQVKAIGTGLHPTQPVARLCRTDTALGKSLLSELDQGRGVTLQSYLTTGNTWRLAQWLGGQTRQIIHVAGPSARLSRRVNDKLWFSDLARRVLDRDAVPPTLRAFGPAAAAGLVRRIARQGEAVIVKVPDSAGSAGNIRLDSETVADAPLLLLQRFLRRRLHAIGWAGRFPLLVGVWDSNVVCSPSVQLWIPQREAGLPRLDGIFEQRVRGLGAAFVGGERTTLPVEVQSRLARDAVLIASVLQRVGYFGRCSFDAVMVKGQDQEAQPHWIECNGRWGGVSIPMTAALRLNGGTMPEGLAFLQATVGARSLTMPELLACLDPLLYRSGRSAEGIVIAAPPGSGADPQISLMAMAGEQQQTRQLMELAVARLRL